MPSKRPGGINWRNLAAQFEAREAGIGVVGLGYVGLPVALAFVEAGFRVIGVDIDESRVADIENNSSFLHDIDDDRLESARQTGRLTAFVSYEALETADAVLICVPTPLTDGAPDVSAIRDATTRLAGVLRREMLIVLESTTYPGTTEEVVAPLLEESGLKVGRDFWLAFSPERIDPGNYSYGFSDIPKIVGGVDTASTRVAEALYAQVVPKVAPVSSPREAEMAKLIENTYRHVNIALINELAAYAHEWGVDIWEAIEAAATKPFGFMPFYPGPGWGGHCIPLDPSYLSWRVRREHAHDLRFVELAHKVNAEMPGYIVERISRLLNKKGRALKGAKILGVGVAYKAGTEDTRGSAGLKVLNALAKQGTRVSFSDPLVPKVEVNGKLLPSQALTPRNLADKDLVVIFVPQVGIDWDKLRTGASLIFDCCNALRGANGRVVAL